MYSPKQGIITSIYYDLLIRYYNVQWNY